MNWPAVNAVAQIVAAGGGRRHQHADLSGGADPPGHALHPPCGISGADQPHRRHQPTGAAARDRGDHDQGAAGAPFGGRVASALRHVCSWA